jgi:hypothetical protein
MNKKNKTRNKKTRNKKKIYKRKMNKTKKQGGVDVASLTSELVNETNKDKEPSTMSQMGDKFSKTKDKYSLENLKKRKEEWEKNVKEEVEKEKERRKNEPKTSLKDKMKDMGSKGYNMGSKAFGSIKNTVTPIGKGSMNYISNGISSLGNQVISDEHKELIKVELEKLKKENKLTEKEFKHAIEQIEKRDGVLGIKDTFMNMLAPVQEMVKVLGDWVFNTGDADFPSKQTHVKLLWVPKMYKHYVKDTIPEKNQKPDLEVDDFMVIIKETNNSPMEKIYSDMNSVDSLLANTLNGCIGPGCKNGTILPPILMEKDIHVHKFDSGAKSAIHYISSKCGEMLMQIGFVIEGRSNDEWPECLFGCVAVNKPQEELAEYLFE